MSSKVVTRFAPSPTGLLHVGNYRTALFSYLFALQNRGKFVLRIEDTDKARSKKEYEENILESLNWLGFKHDEFFRQSERADIHKSYIEKLIKSGHAYVSKETPKEEGDRAEVIRFKNPNKKVKFNDLIRGDIEFDTTELGDFVIAKSMTEPVFHLVVVVDDFEMGITHVIRGEDHISNTPRHILIQEAIGAPTPLYAHLPLILAPDRSKLSKRKGALAITEYREKGYLPETMINFMALLGWNPGTDQELFTMDELVKTFDLSKVQKSGAIFNEEKLGWVNKKYIEKMTAEEFREEAKSFLPENLREKSEKLLPLIKEKINKFSDIPELFNTELSFTKGVPDYAKESLKWRQEKDLVNTKEYLNLVLEKILALEDFSKESVKSALWPIAEEKGKGAVLWPMRYALSGRDQSPDPFILAEILGKDESIKRLKNALSKL
ncbi:MAG: glutamate--tRNA ligase [bacterium]|nr:glutamate--tRNA ligase [bacterium]